MQTESYKKGFCDIVDLLSPKLKISYDARAISKCERNQVRILLE